MGESGRLWASRRCSSRPSCARSDGSTHDLHEARRELRLDSRKGIDGDRTTLEAAHRAFGEIAQHAGAESGVANGTPDLEILEARWSDRWTAGGVIVLEKLPPRHHALDGRAAVGEIFGRVSGVGEFPIEQADEFVSLDEHVLETGVAVDEHGGPLHA